MVNTYSKIYNHFVFAVQNRLCLIQPTWQDELYKYISGIITKHNCKVISIGGVEDHIHVLVGMSTDIAPSTLMADVKRSSSLWINSNHFTPFRFSWQEGYGVFSYSRSAISNVSKYIENQNIHHNKKTFREEYLKILKQFDVDYDENYIFHSI